MGRTGQRIAGRYRLVEKLGTGGMSVIWRGYDETLGRSVAVKVLSPRHADDRTFRDRLRQEALAAARLNHPHITGIFDFGESPLNERLTVPFVVMELNDGESVAARLGRQGPLLWRDAVTVAAEVASALATAHARGVVHRDVTPANVMLTGAGAKVVDFGISAIVGQRDAAPDGSLLGTPAYLAPERLAGAQVSAATDVYALGLLLYRMLTARLPWPAETTAEALRAHLYADPDPLPDLGGLPAAVAGICLACLAKNPDDRPSAAEAAQVLGTAVGLQPVIPPLRERRDDAPPPVRAAVSARSVPGFAVSRLAGPVGLLWLRAGLKLGGMLRLGGAIRPLGGGLFAGGGLPRQLLTGAGLLRGRHRMQAAVVMTALVLGAGAGWAATRRAPEVEQARAAGAGAGAVPAAAGTTCAVRYQLRRDSGTEYEALLTVVTTDEVGRAPWRVQFSYPGSQRLTGMPKAVSQKGRKVVAKGNGRLRTFTLRGAYRDYNPLPIVFTLEGRRCRAEVVGSVAAAPATTAKPKRNRPHRKGGTPQRKADRTVPSLPLVPSLPPGPSLAAGPSLAGTAGGSAILRRR